MLAEIVAAFALFLLLVLIVVLVCEELSYKPNRKAPDYAVLVIEAVVLRERLEYRKDIQPTRRRLLKHLVEERLWRRLTKAVQADPELRRKFNWIG